MSNIPSEFVGLNKPLTGEFEKKVKALAKRGKTVDEICNQLHRGNEPPCFPVRGSIVTDTKSPSWYLLRKRIEKLVGTTE